VGSADYELGLLTGRVAKKVAVVGFAFGNAGVDCHAHGIIKAGTGSKHLVYIFGAAVEGKGGGLALKNGGYGMRNGGGGTGGTDRKLIVDEIGGWKGEWGVDGFGQEPIEFGGGCK
jgi:hypothetical protein